MKTLSDLGHTYYILGRLQTPYRTLIANHRKTRIMVGMSVVVKELGAMYRPGEASSDMAHPPLFIEAPDRNERFQPSDSVSFLHTMRAPRWSCAA